MSFELSPSDALSLKLDEIDRELLAMKDRLDVIQVAKHNKEKEIVDLSESIRKGKFLISKKNIEKEITQREFWRSKS